MPIPWAPFDGPFTFAATWAFAMFLGNDRALSHRIKQVIRWDNSCHQWKVEDE